MNFNNSNARRVQTRKRTSRALSRAHRVIEKLNKKLEASERQNKTISKRYERAVEKLQHHKDVPGTINDDGSEPAANADPLVKDTPRSKVSQQLKQVGLQSVPPIIRKQLQFSHAIMQEVRHSVAEDNGQRHKTVLSWIISGRVVKKYRFITQTKKQTGLGWRSLAGVSATKKTCIGLQQQRKAWTSLQDDVLSFLERDDNSRIMPGKKDACKTDVGKVQKRVLTDYLHNLHAKYMSENPEKKHVSLSAFSRVRQRNKHIKLVNFAARSTSLCQKHQNIALKLKALQSLHLLSNTNPDEFVTKHDDEAVGELLQKLSDDDSIQFVDYDVWKRMPTKRNTVERKPNLSGKCPRKTSLLQALKRAFMNLEVMLHASKCNTVLSRTAKQLC